MTVEVGLDLISMKFGWHERQFEDSDPEQELQDMWQGTHWPPFMKKPPVKSQPQVPVTDPGVCYSLKLILHEMQLFGFPPVHLEQLWPHGKQFPSRLFLYSPSLQIFMQEMLFPEGEVDVFSKPWLQTRPVQSRKVPPEQDKHPSAQFLQIPSLSRYCLSAHQSRHSVEFLFGTLTSCFALHLKHSDGLVHSRQSPMLKPVGGVPVLQGRHVIVLVLGRVLYSKYS